MESRDSDNNLDYDYDNNEWEPVELPACILLRRELMLMHGKVREKN